MGTDDDAAIAAWNAYRTAHNAQLETHGDPVEVRMQGADGGRGGSAPGRAEDPAPPDEQASAENARRPEG